MTTPKPGDWVRVWGQVVRNFSQPGDVLVEFFSSNDQYQAWVKADRVMVDENSPFAKKCNAYHTAVGYDHEDGVLMRCLRASGHADLHEDYDGERWHDDDDGGFLDE